MPLAQNVLVNIYPGGVGEIPARLGVSSLNTLAVEPPGCGGLFLPHLICPSKKPPPGLTGGDGFRLALK